MEKGWIPVCGKSDLCRFSHLGYPTRKSLLEILADTCWPANLAEQLSRSVYFKRVVKLFYFVFLYLYNILKLLGVAVFEYMAQHSPLYVRYL